MSSERIDALEELAAHQARMIEELSTEMALQGALVRNLQKRLDALSKRFLALEDSVTPAAEAKRPPHW